MLRIWRVMFEWWQWQFSRLGWLVGRRPLASIFVACIVIILCSLGLLRASFIENIDALWVPSTSKTIVDQRKFDAYFPTNPFSRVERVIIVPKDPSADMLQPHLLNQTYNIYMSLLNLTVTANDNSTVGIKHMCAQPVKNGGCVYYSPLAYWKDDRALMLSRTDAQLHADVDELLLSGLIPVQQRQVLGCLVKTPSKVYEGNYDVKSVGALIFTFFLDVSLKGTPTVERWETALLDMLDTYPYEDVVAYAATGVSTSQEISRQSRGDVFLLGASYIIMTLYMLVALTTFKPFRTRFLLGLGALATVASGILSSLGFSALFYQFNPLTIQVLPFVMLSIGMDSVFILYTHFQKSLTSITHTPLSNLDIAMALEDALYRQGASVALTALTKAVSFLCPCIVLRIPALQEFCIVVAIAVLFELLFSFTAFNAFLILDARRERDNRYDCIPCLSRNGRRTKPQPSQQELLRNTSAANPFPHSASAVDSAAAAATAAAVAAAAAAAAANGGGDCATDGAAAAANGAVNGGANGAAWVPLSQSRSPPATDVTVEGAGDDKEAIKAAHIITAPPAMASEPTDPAATATAAAGNNTGAVAAAANGTGYGAKLSNEEKQQRKAEKRAKVKREGGLIDISGSTEKEAKTFYGRFICLYFVPYALCHWAGQLVIFLVFGALLGVGIYGCITVDETLDVRTLITQGTQLYHYLGYEESCNTHIGPPMYLVTENIDYASLQNRPYMERLTGLVQNSTWIEPPVFSWYRDFTEKFLPYSKWVTQLDSNGQLPSRELFHAALDNFLNDSMEGFAYTYDFAFERNNGTGAIEAIKAARMRAFYNPLKGTGEFVNAMLDVRGRVDSVPQVPAFTQSYFYVFYEQFLDIVQQYTWMLVLTIIGIFCITFIFMGFKTAIIVSAMVLMIHISMLGLTAEWGVQLNAVSAVNAVAIMGLADEYVNYIMRAFELDHGNPQDRIRSALLQYIRPITNAACCTVLGILPLAFAKSAVYNVYYFRMFLVATLLSWGTGIIFLPAFLLALHGVGMTKPLYELGLAAKEKFLRWRGKKQQHEHNSDDGGEEGKKEPGESEVAVPGEVRV